MKNFFISYNGADEAWAKWIAWQLEADGYTTVIQAWDFQLGANFVVEMDQAAKQAERTIAVLSPDFLASRFAQSEWAVAFAKDPTGEKGLLVPVRVRAYDPEGLLPQIVYVDLVGRSREEARQALLDGVKRGRAKSDTEPPFPSQEAAFPLDTPVPSTLQLGPVSPAKNKKGEGLAQELLESPLVGLWKDRDDIKDSVAFARELREKAHRRVD